MGKVGTYFVFAIGLMLAFGCSDPEGSSDPGEDTPDICPEWETSSVGEGAIDPPTDESDAERVDRFRYKIDRQAGTLTLFPQSDGEEIGRVVVEYQSASRKVVHFDLDDLPDVEAQLDVGVTVDGEYRLDIMSEIKFDVADHSRSVIGRETVTVEGEEEATATAIYAVTEDRFDTSEDVLELSGDIEPPAAHEQVRTWLGETDLEVVSEVLHRVRFDEPEMMRNLMQGLFAECFVDDESSQMTERSSPLSTASDLENMICEFKEDMGEALQDAVGGIPTSIGDLLPGPDANEEAVGQVYDNIGDDDHPCNTNDRDSGGSHGDPHLETIDGLAYDLQSVGEFLLIDSSEGDDLQVQTRHAAIDTGRCPTVSANSAVAAQLGEYRVGVYAEREETLWLDGEPADLSGGFVSLGDGYRIEKRGGESYVLIWPDGTRVDVTKRLLSMGDIPDILDIRVALSESRQQEVRGLLGNYSGDTDDDLALRDGTVVEQPVDWQRLHGEFANSWRLTEEETLFDYAEGEGSEDHTDRGVPVSPTTLDVIPEDEREEAETTCIESGLDPDDEGLVRDCVIDVYCGGTDEFVASHRDREQPPESLEVEFEAGDEEPDLSFQDTVAPADQWVESNPIMLVGFEGPITVELRECETDCEISVNGGEFTQQVGDVRWGDQLQVRQLASAEYGGAITAEVDIGQSISKDWTVISWFEEPKLTNCGAEGRLGPEQDDCDTAYEGTGLADFIEVENGIQRFTVPASGSYQITAWGAEGGGYHGGDHDPGEGAGIWGEFELEEGDELDILIGQVGEVYEIDDEFNSAAGGGGGTFVVERDATDTDDVLVIAGGGGAGIGHQSSGDYTGIENGQISLGGGSGYVGCCGSYSTDGGTDGEGAPGPEFKSQGGGGGFYTDGADADQGGAEGGQAFLNGGLGGDADDAPGGFGGGGGANDEGDGHRIGAGGGYSGGGVGYVWNGEGVVGGGGSINTGYTGGVASRNEGHGEVTIELVE